MKHNETHWRLALGFSSSVYLVLPGISMSYPWPHTAQHLRLPSVPHPLGPLGIQPHRPTFLSPFSKGSIEETFVKGVEKTIGKIKGKGASVSVSVYVCILRPRCAQVNFLALEGRNPSCHHLTNEEMEAQPGAIISWAVAQPGFKMRTFLSLSC